MLMLQPNAQQVEQLIAQLEKSMAEDDPNRFFELLQLKKKYTDNVSTYDVLQSAFEWAIAREYVGLLEELLTIPGVRENAHMNNNRMLYEASLSGSYSGIVPRLLALPNVFKNAHVAGNRVLVQAAFGKHKKIVSRLLDNPEVLANAHVKNNIVLNDAIYMEDIDIINRLLTVPGVFENVHVHMRDNNALYFYRGISPQKKI